MIVSNASGSEQVVIEQWEYKTAEIFGTATIADELNRLGYKGWELVGMSDGMGNYENLYVFKRRLVGTHETG